MGGRGTDVAREAAALVILDANFSSIVEGIRGGRRIFDNIQKAMGFIFSIHVTIAGLALLPLLLDWPLVLTPVHIVFLELIIDPACSIAFESEPEEADVMARPPRDPNAPLFSARNVFLSLLQGAVVLIIVLFTLGISVQRGQTDAQARALTFGTLVLGVLSLITVNRSRSSSVLQILRSANTAYLWVVAGTFGFLAAVLYATGLQKIFRFDSLRLADLAICLAGGIMSFLLIELLKLNEHHS
jgi:Ca2+-transporting ATPase